jgi:hypothetical protein
VRLPFPERISLVPVVGYAIVLSALQIYQGTAPEFSLCCVVFIVVSAIAFNVAGGMTRPSGAYIICFAVLGVLIGLTWKAFLGEAADSNLLVPMLTIRIYVAASFGLLAAAYISRRLTSRRAFLADFATDDKLQSATVGSLVTGVVLTTILAVVPWGTGTILSALGQINRILPMAIVLGVIHTIRRSGGTRSISLFVVLAMACLFAQGVFSFSKEGMITPFVCWLLPAAANRYRVTLAQVAGGILLTFFLFQYLVPYSQYGRTQHAESFSENLDVAVSLLTHPAYVREQFIDTQVDLDDDLARGYFTNHQGFFDRLQMIGPDDSLNNLTEQGNVPGILPIFLDFENLIPHFLWPNKPTWGGGNLYARQMGVVGEDDTTTGISFSPAGEAFHLMRWTGILLVAPILWILLFTLFDSLCGDLRKSPWGLFIAIVFSHIAPEGGIGAVIYSFGVLTAGIMFLAITGTYVMPLLGEILIGPGRKSIRLVEPRSRPRMVPVPPSENPAG